MSEPDLASPLPRARVAPPGLPGIGSLLTLAVGVIVVVALDAARAVLMPVTLAVLLSFLVAPLVNLLRRARLGRVGSALLAMLLALGVILAVGSVIASQIADLADGLPQYEDTLRAKSESLQAATVGRLDAVIARVGHQLHPTPPAPSPMPAPAGRHAPHPPAPGTSANPLTVQVQSPAPSAIELAGGLITPLLGPLGTLFLVFLVATFILLQQADLRDRLIRLVGSTDLHRTTLALNDAARRLSKYFLTQLAINTGFGVVIGGGLAVIGVPNPVLWGVLAMLLRFVPYLGAPLAALFPLLLAAGVDPGWSMVVRTALLFGVTEAITGQAVEPLAYGHSTGLSPVSVVVSAIFWTWLWGPVGLILSTPLTLCLVVLGRHVKRLEFLDVLLGDTPALTPVETLYQRLLANDPEEAAHQAARLLRDRSLSAFYEEVAMPAIALAAADVARGVLTREKLLPMRDAICALVEDLSDHEDVAPSADQADDGAAAPSAAERAVPILAPISLAPPPADILPPPWRVATPILVLAGRGPLDDAVAAMLAQLLAKHGLAARTLPHEAATRAAIHTIDLTDTALICIPYLSATGSPGHLRAVLRALRRQRPRLPILVGLWGEPREAPEELDFRAIPGADYFATTLGDAIAFCLREAQQAAEARAA